MPQPQHDVAGNVDGAVPARQAGGMTDDQLDALAAALGIPLRPEWREAVRTNLDISLRLGSLVAAFPLEDEAELAPVFRP